MKRLFASTLTTSLMLGLAAWAWASPFVVGSHCRCPLCP